MSTLPVTILPIAATVQEVEEMQEVTKQAFGPDPLIDFCFNRPNIPRTPKEETTAKHLERMATPEFIYHKAIDASSPDGPMLGVAAWYIVENPYTTTQNIPWGDPTPEVHLECYDASLGALRRWRQRHFEETGQPFVYMALLVIAPEVQRRGVGSALLREGLKEVDRRGWPAFIEASPYGLGLYKKFGWVETVKTTVNLKDFGGEDVECVTVGLVRPAGAKEVASK
jgi:ribosomal protein S18 acetylase RimI-like enzyme